MDNATLSNLTLAEEDALFKQKPYCIDRYQNYTIQGFVEGLVRQYVSFDIERCVNSANITCATDNEIDNFLARHQFKIYSLQSKIDFKTQDKV